MPEAVAVNPAIPDVPPNFKTLFALLVNVLDPARAVATVKVPLFWVVPLMVKLGMLIVPEMVLVVPLIV